MVARGLVGQLVEATDEVFEDEPHLLVGHAVGMQVDVADLRDDQEQDARLAHLLDLALELEEVEDTADVGREALDVAVEVLGDVVGIALELLEVQRRVVVEPLARRLVQPGIEGFALELVLGPRVLGKHLGLGRREHAVESAEHRHGKHDALVLRRTVRTTQQVGDLPDEVREVVVVRHGGSPDQSASSSFGGPLRGIFRGRPEPAVDHRSVEAPMATHLLAGDLALLGQLVDRGLRQLQVGDEVVDGEDRSGGWRVTDGPGRGAARTW
ncbi:MAG: hypothetical protein U0575_15030 [Phycisphaerales bacterium]